MRNEGKLSLLAVVAFVAVHGFAAETPEGLSVYCESSILRNGDFKLKGLNHEIPAFWLTRGGERGDLVEDMPRYGLKDGVQRMESPAPGLTQELDLTPITAWDFELFFEAYVESGALEVSASPFNFSKRIEAGKDFSRQNFPCSLAPSVSSALCSVTFRPIGDNAVIKLRDVQLKPTPPAGKVGAKELFIDAGEKSPLRGIAVTEDGTDFERFYNLKAAQYLRKYIFVNYGLFLEIFTGQKDPIQKLRGFVCFGNSLIDDGTMGKVTVGGYALKSENGKILVGGKDDGAVQGTFALLSGLGMGFFEDMSDFQPATGDTIKPPSQTLVCNPSIPARHMHYWRVQSFAPIGENCSELHGSTAYIGQRRLSDHTNGVLVDPFAHFKDHPEYYALMKDGKRSWNGKSMGNLHLCLSNPEVQRISAETAIKWFDLCPGMKYLCVCQGDGTSPDDWCQCENCAKFGGNAH